jgi:hypothetical protein
MAFFFILYSYGSRPCPFSSPHVGVKNDTKLVPNEDIPPSLIGFTESQIVPDDRIKVKQSRLVGVAVLAVTHSHMRLKPMRIIAKRDRRQEQSRRELRFQGRAARCG